MIECLTDNVNRSATEVCRPAALPLRREGTAHTSGALLY